MFRINFTEVTCTECSPSRSRTRALKGKLRLFGDVPQHVSVGMFISFPKLQDLVPEVLSLNLFLIFYTPCLYGIYRVSV